MRCNAFSNRCRGGKSVSSDDPQSKPLLVFAVSGDCSFSYLRRNFTAHELEGEKSVRKKATQFEVVDGLLWLRLKNKGYRSCVDDDPDPREQILQACQAKFSNRGRGATIKQVQDMYWWKGLYTDDEKATPLRSASSMLSQTLDDSTRARFQRCLTSLCAGCIWNSSVCRLIKA